MMQLIKNRKRLLGSSVLLAFALIFIPFSLSPSSGFKPSDAFAQLTPQEALAGACGGMNQPVINNSCTGSDLSGNVTTYSLSADGTQVITKTNGGTNAAGNPTQLTTTTNPANNTGTLTTTDQITGASATQNLKPFDPSTCSLNPFYFSVSNCWNALLQSIGTFFLMIGASILEFAGLIFDTFINTIIIGFGSSLQSLGIITAITTGWDAFRDLANILIIGMFVFIAISTILGSKEYGYKKLVARVLVIAVLMNFSLLFTKLIIDASNFTAYQFYTQLSGQTPQSGSNSQTFDTAAAFLQPLGITSVFNAGNLTQGVNKVTGSGFQAFLVGLIGGIMLVVVAAVLFYATILIGARAVVLIVLMLTSAVAFATYLLPNFAGSKYGWKGWWEALINCAVFAPLLMLFLALSLLIIKGGISAANVIQPNSNINLGTIIQNPSSVTTVGNQGWQIIMTYLITIGLLYVSLKISSTFASSTSGINLSIAAFRAPFAIGGRMIGAGAGVLGARYGTQAAAGEAVAKKEAARRARVELKDIKAGTPAYKDQSIKVADLDRAAEKAAKRAGRPTTLSTSKGIAGAIFGRKPDEKKPEEKKKDAVEVRKEAATNAPITTPAPVQAQASASSQTPANDNTAKMLKEAAENLEEASKANVKAAKTFEESAAPIANNAIDKAKENAGAAQQREESQSRERFSEQKVNIENATETARANSSATSNIISQRLGQAQRSSIMDMLTRTRNKTDDTPLTSRAAPLQSDVAMNVPSAKPEEAPPMVPNHEDLLKSDKPPVNITIRPSGSPPPPAPDALSSPVSPTGRGPSSSDAATPENNTA